jgi:nucleoside-diphosphate-sugar epimerase
MRILLTGATGFIGSTLSRRLVCEGHQVVSVGRSRPAAGCGDFVLWDFSTMIDPPPDLPRVDGIIHLAQSRMHRNPLGASADIVRVNILGTVAVLEYAINAGVDHFCLVSSGTVYQPYDLPLCEDTPVAPNSILGATKLAAEVVARPYAERLSLGILRLFFPFGPGQVNRLIPDLARRIQAGEPVTIAGGGDGHVLVPTFVEDIVDVLRMSTIHHWRGTFNVATPVPTTIRQLAEAIGRVVGVAPSYERVAGPELRIVPDLKRLAAKYDLSRCTPLERGLVQTFA